MRYLKTYQLFESSEMLDTNIISDLLQEITDMGYRSHVETSWWSDDNKSNKIEITIYGKTEYVKNIGKEHMDCEIDFVYPGEVMDTVDRLVSYLKSEGYSLYDEYEKILNHIRKRESMVPAKSPRKKIKISEYSVLEFIWDDKTNDWKITYTLSLAFKK